MFKSTVSQNHFLACVASCADCFGAHILCLLISVKVFEVDVVRRRLLVYSIYRQRWITIYSTVSLGAL